jgi:hypothetical protein
VDVPAHAAILASDNPALTRASVASQGGAGAGESGITLRGLKKTYPAPAIGILFGHLMTPDSIGPGVGGTTAVFALLDGVWFPITHGVMHAIAEAQPSYWLMQAGHVGLGGKAWGATGWAVVAAWTVACAVLARPAYERDTRRV